MRPTIGVWAAGDSHGIELAMRLTSPRVWSPWTRRLLLASVVSALGAVGPFTWIVDLLDGL
jgi:ABC-type transporter Mla maintaining outer membrane lipid asymmetry permease subunit MlaE